MRAEISFSDDLNLSVRVEGVMPLLVFEWIVDEFSLSLRFIRDLCLVHNFFVLFDTDLDQLLSQGGLALSKEVKMLCRVCTLAEINRHLIVLLALDFVPGVREELWNHCEQLSEVREIDCTAIRLRDR